MLYIFLTKIGSIINSSCSLPHCFTIIWITLIYFSLFMFFKRYCSIIEEADGGYGVSVHMFLDLVVFDMAIWTASPNECLSIIPPDEPDNSFLLLVNLTTSWLTRTTDLGVLDQQLTTAPLRRLLFFTFAFTCFLHTKKNRHTRFYCSVNMIILLLSSGESDLKSLKMMT